MRLAFLGTPDFAVPTLQALAAAGHEIARVYTQPPRPAGRGRAPRPSAVHQATEALGLAVETPERFSDSVESFEALRPDLAVVVAYGQILTPRALAAPRLGCLNLHASLLPRWRGAAPIQRAIMAGDAETGAAVMRMEAGLDTGPVLAEARTPIGPEDTARTLHDRLAAMGARLMAGTVARLAEGPVEAVPQAADGVTYARKIDKPEARVDWSRSAREVAAHINSLSPFPGAWTTLDAQRLKLLLARSEDGEGRPGEVLDDRLLVACGEGAVRVLKVQREGRAAQEAETFLRGTPVPAGTTLV